MKIRSSQLRYSFALKPQSNLDPCVFRPAISLLEHVSGRLIDRPCAGRYP